MNNFDNKKNDVLDVFQGRTREIYQNITLLPKFNTSKTWDEQSDFYNEGFEHFVKGLIQKLEKSKNEAFGDYQQTFDVFKDLTKIIKKQNLGDLAKEANENAKKSMFERLFKTKIDFNQLLKLIIFVTILKMMKFYHFHNTTQLQLLKNLIQNYKKKFHKLFKVMNFL